MGLKVWTSWGPGCKNSKSPSRLDFLKIIQKVEFKISQLLERPFCELSLVSVFAEGQLEHQKVKRIYSEPIISLRGPAIALHRRAPKARVVRMGGGLGGLMGGYQKGPLDFPLFLV